MRVMPYLALLAGTAFSLSRNTELAAQSVTQEVPKTASAGAAKDTSLADRTRTKLLKVKVSASFEKVSLRDVLKELAGQVEMAVERPVMWTYADSIPADTPVSYSCKNKALDAVLDELFKKHGLGYVVISKMDDKHDGWVRVTKGDERGYDTSPPKIISSEDEDEEKKAAGRLAIAKDLIDKGKPADAKAVLMLVVNKFPKTKAAIEAKELLEKLNK
jgi:hypothetical protein